MERGNLALRVDASTASINAIVEKNTCCILSSTPTLQMPARTGRQFPMPGAVSNPPSSPSIRSYGFKVRIRVGYERAEYG